MIQKYKVDEFLIHRKTKQLLQILNIFKDFDYTTFYEYEVFNFESGKTEKLSQSYMECKYVSRREIGDEIMAHEKEVNKLVDEISALKWLQEEMKNKLNYIKNGKDSKR